MAPPRAEADTNQAPWKGSGARQGRLEEGRQAEAESHTHT